MRNLGPTKHFAVDPLFLVAKSVDCWLSDRVFGEDKAHFENVALLSETLSGERFNRFSESVKWPSTEEWEQFPEVREHFQFIADSPQF